MKKVIPILSIILILITIPLVVYYIGENQELRKRAAPATTLSFTPSTVSVAQGQTFSLDVLIDPADNQVVVGELFIQYDPTIVEALTISNSSLFPNVLTPGSVSPGSASITVGANSATEPIVTPGVMATVTFKASAATTAPTTITFSQNTFIAAINESQTNVFIGGTPASVTITVAGTPVDNPFSVQPTPDPYGDTPLPTPMNNLTIQEQTEPIPTVTATPSPIPTDIPDTTELRILSPLPNETLSNPTPTFTGTSAPNATITIAIYSAVQNAVVQADANGSWSYTPEQPLEPGLHSIVITEQHPDTQETRTATASFVLVESQNTTKTKQPTPVSGTTETTLVLGVIAALLVILGIVIPVL